ncbi:MAG: hypothetical protein KAU28_10995, partial [Phycisphaerae bacterium]|nr:hypothetical protein [Phycisphaerae bacterium]
TEETLMANLRQSLAERLEGTGNLQGATISYDGQTVVIPPIAFDGQDRCFEVTFSLADDSSVYLRVNGRAGAICRSAGMNLQLMPGASAVFDYGIASRSSIRMMGNASVTGENDPSEANILSATYDDPEAFKLTGNPAIEGDIYASNPDAYVRLTGNASIGGETNGSEDIEDHIHVGIGEVEFPEVAPAVFEPFATNIVNSSTPTSGNRTFSNIRILAGSNKTFSGNITLNGVIFIEAPNTVHFSGNVTITGVIVTEDAGEGVYDSNTIKFTGNTVARGVGQLPDTPEFHELRNMPGSFLLAPGFGVQFTGNFGTVNGTMAADSFKFAGNSSGTVHGTIINYSDSEFKLTGTTKITIDRSDAPGSPTGFATPFILTVNPNSYTEY